jgi:hypothetical protein
MSKNMMSMLFTLLFTCLDFSGLGDFYSPCTAHALFPERLPDHCQYLRRTISEICTTFVTVRLLDSLQNRITRLQLI